MTLRAPSIIIFLLMGIIQVSLGDYISIMGVKPSFILIVVYALSITGGELRGILYGALGGFVEDCLSGGYLGLFMSGYALVGYLAGRAGKKVFNIGEAANFSGIFMLSLVNGIYTSAVLEALRGGADIFGRIVRFALPLAAYNAVIGAVVLYLFKEQVTRRVPWLKQLQVRL